MAITLQEAKVGMADKVDQQVVDMFRRSSLLLDNMVFDNCIAPGTGGSTLTYGYIQLKNPATAGVRTINTEYVPGEAKREKKTADAIIMGGAFQVDRVLQNTAGAADELAFQAEEKIKATANFFHNMAIGPDSTLTILTGTATVAHNADGTLDMPVSFWINTPVEEWTPGYMAGDRTMALTDIPRASKIQVANANIGERATLAITQYSPSYTHSVRYLFGDQSGYVSADGNAVDDEEIFSETSIGFLLPESFYREIPNAPYGVGTLTVTTYAGDIPIGTESAPFTATADPSDCAPKVTFSAKDINEKTLALTKNENTFIRHCSTVSCQVTAQGQKGATVTSVLVNGREEQEFTAVEEVLELVVTDSRGYETKEPLTLSMLDYVMLTCHATAKRESPTSNRVLLQVTGQHHTGSFPGSDNLLHLYTYLPDGTQTDIPYTESEDTYTGELAVDVPYQQSFEFQVVAADKLNEASDGAYAARGLPVFDWGENDFAFHVPVAFQAPEQPFDEGYYGQAALRYGRVPGDFDPDGVTENSLLWCYDENDLSKEGLWLTLAPFPGNVVFQICCSPYGDELKYRTRWDYTWYDWHALA